MRHSSAHSTFFRSTCEAGTDSTRLTARGTSKKIHAAGECAARRDVDAVDRTGEALDAHRRIRRAAAQRASARHPPEAHAAAARNSCSASAHGDRGRPVRDRQEHERLLVDHGSARADVGVLLAVDKNPWLWAAAVSSQSDVDRQVLGVRMPAPDHFEHCVGVR
jgi:hypothetical protein